MRSRLGSVTTSDRSRTRRSSTGRTRCWRSPRHRAAGPSTSWCTAIRSIRRARTRIDCLPRRGRSSSRRSLPTKGPIDSRISTTRSESPRSRHPVDRDDFRCRASRRTRPSRSSGQTASVRIPPRFPPRLTVHDDPGSRPDHLGRWNLRRSNRPKDRDDIHPAAFTVLQGGLATSEYGHHRPSGVGYRVSTPQTNLWIEYRNTGMHRCPLPLLKLTADQRRGSPLTYSLAYPTPQFANLSPQVTGTVQVLATGSGATPASSSRATPSASRSTTSVAKSTAITTITFSCSAPDNRRRLLVSHLHVIGC